MKETCRPKPESGLPELRPIEGREADEELALLAKALSHPTRVEIVLPDLDSLVVQALSNR